MLKIFTALARVFCRQCSSSKASCQGSAVCFPWQDRQGAGMYFPLPCTSLSPGRISCIRMVDPPMADSSSRCVSVEVPLGSAPMAVSNACMGTQYRLSPYINSTLLTREPRPTPREAVCNMAKIFAALACVFRKRRSSPKYIQGSAVCQRMH